MHILLPWVTSALHSVIYLSLTVIPKQTVENTHRIQNTEKKYFLVYHSMHVKISMQTFLNKIKQALFGKHFELRSSSFSWSFIMYCKKPRNIKF